MAGWFIVAPSDNSVSDSGQMKRFIVTPCSLTLAAPLGVRRRDVQRKDRGRQRVSGAIRGAAPSPSAIPRDIWSRMKDAPSRRPASGRDRGCQCEVSTPVRELGMAADPRVSAGGGTTPRSGSRGMARRSGARRRKGPAGRRGFYSPECVTGFAAVRLRRPHFGTTCMRTGPAWRRVMPGRSPRDWPGGRCRSNSARTRSCRRIAMRLARCSPTQRCGPRPNGSQA